MDFGIYSRNLLTMDKSTHVWFTSLLANAVAAKYSTSFFNVSFATLASKSQGESECIGRYLFDLVRAYASSTIFIG